MMLCREIINGIEEKYATSFACDWDNVGLLVGRKEKEVHKIYLALDATDEVIGHAIVAGADMLVTHHPMIFGGIKRVNDQDFLGRKIIHMIHADLSYYAMHTNFDVKGMADLAADILELENRIVLDETVPGNPNEGVGRVGDLPKVMTLREACEHVKKALKLSNVKVFGDGSRQVKRAALCPGSGKSEIAESLRKGVDVLITGDIDHHAGLDAVEQGLMIIDAGHYGTEYIFIDEMERYLNGRFPEIAIAKEPVRGPFEIVWDACYADEYEVNAEKE